MLLRLEKVRMDILFGRGILSRRLPAYDLTTVHANHGAGRMYAARYGRVSWGVTQWKYRPIFRF